MKLVGLIKPKLAYYFKRPLSSIFSKLIGLSLHRFLTSQNEIAWKSKKRLMCHYLLLRLGLLHALAGQGFLNYSTSDI